MSTEFESDGAYAEIALIRYLRFERGFYACDEVSLYGCIADVIALNHRKREIIEDLLADFDDLKNEGITLETQNRIQSHIKKVCELDFLPDGSGCESGDPVDLTLAEIEIGVGTMQDKYEEKIGRLKGFIRERCIPNS